MSAGDLFRAGAVAIGLLAVATVVRMAGSLLDEELRSRIFRLPHLLLRLARRRLPADLRQLYDQEWLPDLEFIVRATEGLPVTRLVRGTSHALGILVSARRIVQAHDPHGRYAIVRDLAGARDRALSLARGVSVLYARLERAHHRAEAIIARASATSTET